jgi:CRP-like cAMP-binding protein
MVLISGEIEAVLDGKTVIRFHPGQLVGDAGAYSGMASQVDVVARSHGTLTVWDMQHLAEFAASRPELRAQLMHIMSADLAAKLRHIIASHLAEQRGRVGCEPGQP